MSSDTAGAALSRQVRRRFPSTCRRDAEAGPPHRPSEVRNWGRNIVACVVLAVKKCLLSNFRSHWVFPSCDERGRSPAGQLFSLWMSHSLHHVPAGVVGPRRTGGLLPLREGWLKCWWSWPFLLFLWPKSSRTSCVAAATGCLTDRLLPSSVVPSGVCTGMWRQQERSAKVTSSCEFRVCSLVLIMIVNPAMRMLHSLSP